VIGAGIPLKETVVPESCVQMLPAEFMWYSANCAGPRPEPYKTTISPGETGPRRLLAPFVTAPTTTGMRVSLRTRLTSESPINTLPSVSTASPTGTLSSTDVAGPVSPLKQQTPVPAMALIRSEEHTSELQSLRHLVC